MKKVKKLKKLQANYLNIFHHNYIKTQSLVVKKKFQLKVKKNFLTVFFSDIISFTEISDKMDLIPLDRNGRIFFKQHKFVSYENV